jgi:three-Cys-motif partner protein
MQGLEKNILNEPETSYYWGGRWTKEKISIFIKYIPAYLRIMNRQSFKLIYFDGFAGSGNIPVNEENYLQTVALQVISMNNPRPFDMYYLVDRDKEKSKQLEQIIKKDFRGKQIFVVSEDCNIKLRKLAQYLQEHKEFRALAFLDPYGMQVNFKSLESFKGLSCDMWMLIPSGIGINRMLPRDGDIPSAWIKKLSSFLGLTEEEIKKEFYKQEKEQTLFGTYTFIKKEDKAIHKIIQLYSMKLNTIWDYVSEPLPLFNNKNALMFHFLMVSQNRTALKIANDIITKMKEI